MPITGVYWETSAAIVSCLNNLRSGPGFGHNVAMRPQMRSRLETADGNEDGDRTMGGSID